MLSKPYQVSTGVSRCNVHSAIVNLLRTQSRSVVTRDGVLAVDGCGKLVALPRRSRLRKTRKRCASRCCVCPRVLWCKIPRCRQSGTRPSQSARRTSHSVPRLRQQEQKPGQHLWGFIIVDHSAIQHRHVLHPKEKLTWFRPNHPFCRRLK